MTPPRDDYPEDSEVGGPPPRHVHYHQTKNGDRANTILLACLLGIVGFVGMQVWMMNARMSAVEVTLSLLVQRSGLATPPPP